MKNKQEKGIVFFFSFLGIAFIITALYCSFVFPNGLIGYIFVFLGIICFLLDIVILGMCRK